MLAIAEGHVDLSDWLLLLAAIVFFVAAVFPFLRRPRPVDGARVPLAVSVEQVVAVGLCLVAIALLVL